MSASWKRLALLLVILNLFHEATSALQTYGVQDLCGGKIELKSPAFGLESTAKIKPTKHGLYHDSINCSLVVKGGSQPLYELVVSVRTLDFRPNDLDTLTISYLDGFDRRSGSFRNRHSDPSRDHDPTESRSYRSSGDVTVTFSTKPGSHGTAAFEGFAIIVTAVRREPICDSYEFRCDSGVCISDELKCDGHNHCGGNSALDSCRQSKGSSDTFTTMSPEEKHKAEQTTLIAVLVFGAFMVGGLVCFCCSIVRRSGECKTIGCGCCDLEPRYTYRRVRRPIFTINSSGPHKSSSSYVGDSASTGHSAYESNNRGGDASVGYPAYESTYVGGNASVGYSANESTYGKGDASVGYSANESTYGGGDASAGYSAYESTYDASVGYSATESTYGGGDASVGYSANESTYDASVGYSANESTYGAGDASAVYSAYESTYAGGDATVGYSANESTYEEGDASAGYSAYESTYEGGDASVGYSANETSNDYGGDSSADCYSANESTYEGSSVADCSPAD